MPKVDLLVKLAYVDLEWFNFMQLFLVHPQTELSAFCNLGFTLFSVLATNKIAVSLSNVFIVASATSGISLVYKTYKSGPTMQPCKTPAWFLSI